MTFKHAKFEDSVIMRSLEKVAREKGMIKDEPMQKQASATDLKPSNNLMVNILNLCAGLRASGFDKYASELETNFLNYKQATNSLYETDPKAGEKEIETAHPDGSHKLDGVAGDATVETIIDKHLKMLEVSNKDPNGKLESSASVLRAVKKALGQVATPAAPVAPEVLGDPDALVQSAINKLNESINSIATQSNIGRGVNFMKSYVRDIVNLSRDLNVKNVMEMRRLATKILEFASSGNHGVFRRYFESWWNWAGASISDKYDAIQEAAGNIFGGGFEMEPAALKSALDGMSDAIKIFGKTIRVLSEPKKPAIPVATKEEPKTAPVAAASETEKTLKGYDDASNLIKLYKERVSARELKNEVALNAWLDKANTFATNYKSKLDSSPFKSDPEILASSNKKLDLLKSKIEAFKQKWLA